LYTNKRERVGQWEDRRVDWGVDTGQKGETKQKPLGIVKRTLG